MTVLDRVVSSESRALLANVCRPIALRCVRSIRRNSLIVRAMTLKALPVEASVRPASPRTKELANRILLAPGVGPGARALVVGSGALPVIDVLKYLGLQDILVVDSNSEFLQVVTTAHGNPSPLGNQPAVRVWQGDVTELPGFMGPVDVVVFTDEPFGTALTPRDALVRACLVTAPGGSVIINSEDESRRWQPKYPPTRDALSAMVSGLPLQIHSEQEASNGYSGILQVPHNYRLRSPVLLEGQVVRGYGRGSRQMGTPTANIDPAPLREVLAGLSPGVYFGWARLDAPQGWPAADSQVHKAVLNIGSRPTVNCGGEAPSAEVHILHTYQGGQEFYGSHLQVLALGFLRPEIRFSGVEALTARICADIAIARLQLDAPDLAAGAGALAEVAGGGNGKNGNNGSGMGNTH